MKKVCFRFNDYTKRLYNEYFAGEGATKGRWSDWWWTEDRLRIKQREKVYERRNIGHKVRLKRDENNILAVGKTCVRPYERGEMAVKNENDEDDDEEMEEEQ